MSMLERAIEVISPHWALQRERCRLALSSYRNYDAALNGRNERWTPVNQTPEETDAAYRDRIRARSRDLERNSDIAQAAVKALKRNIVGTGVRPQAKTGDKELDDQLEALWKQWVRPENCDITGGSSFYELQQMIIHRRFFDGEILIKPVSDQSKPIPLTLQLIEADYFDTTKIEGLGGRRVLGGVEVDAAYKPVAFWIRERQEFGMGRSKRIPADKMIHYFSKTRPTAVRGLSELAVVMERLKDTGETINAEVIATKISACFAAFVKDEAPVNAVGRLPKNSTGQRVDTIEPGMVHYLGKGQDVTFSTPGRPNPDVGKFLQMMLRYTGSGLGLSYEALSRDVSQANYSSIRQGSLDDRQEWRTAQQSLISHICDPIWSFFVEACVLAQKVRISDFWENREKYTRAVWTSPGWGWIDPLKEVRASKEELASGMTTLAKICAAKGEDWQEVLLQLAREKEFARENGILQEDEGIRNALLELRKEVLRLAERQKGNST